MKKVYIAGKLNDDAVDYIKNMHTMIACANNVRQAGYAVFVPCLDILMGLVSGGYEYQTYFQNSQPWLEVSDAIFICPGWKTSEGTKKEIKRAKELGIPVAYSFEQLNILCPI